MSTINLLPDDYLSRRGRRRANALCLILFGTVMGAITCAYVASERSYQHTRDVSKRIDASYAEASRLIEQMQRLKVQKTRLLLKAEQAAALQERVPRSYILGLITKACPQYVSLIKVRLQFKRIVTGGSKGKGRTAKYTAAARRRSSLPPDMVLETEVTGLASTDVEVAKFIANLAHNRLLTTVDLVYSQERLIGKNKAKVTVREFKIRMELKRDVDVLDLLSETNNESVRDDAVKDRAKAAAGVAS